MDLEKAEARLAELESANAKADGWGAAVGARNEEIKGLKPSIDALKRQEGGNHYLGMGMQPIEFAMANNYDAGAFSILKYASRHASKNGAEDIRKAIHFVDLRERFLDLVVIEKPRIRMADYIDANGYTGMTAKALEFLEHWMLAPQSRNFPIILKRILNVIILENYENRKE